MTARFETLVAGGFPYLVATSAGTVIGYAYVGPFRPVSYTHSEPTRH